MRGPMLEQNLIPTICAVLAYATHGELEDADLANTSNESLTVGDTQAWTMDRRCFLLRQAERFFQLIATHACGLGDLKGIQLLEDILDCIAAWGVPPYHAHHLQCQVLQVSARGGEGAVLDTCMHTHLTGIFALTKEISILLAEFICIFSLLCHQTNPVVLCVLLSLIFLRPPTSFSSQPPLFSSNIFFSYSVLISTVQYVISIQNALDMFCLGSGVPASGGGISREIVSLCALAVDIIVFGNEGGAETASAPRPPAIYGYAGNFAFVCNVFHVLRMLVMTSSPGVGGAMGQASRGLVCEQLGRLIIHMLGGNTRFRAFVLGNLTSYLELLDALQDDQRLSIQVFLAIHSCLLVRGKERLNPFYEEEQALDVRDEQARRLLAYMRDTQPKMYRLVVSTHCEKEWDLAVSFGK